MNGLLANKISFKVEVIDPLFEEMASTSFYTLFESSSGFALFNVLESEEIASMVADVQNGTTDFSRFQRVVRLLAFQPFISAEDALENISAVTEHQVTEGLRVSDGGYATCVHFLMELHYFDHRISLMRTSQRERSQSNSH